MDPVAPETEEYIRESIESSLGLQISAKNLQLKLIASEDARRRIQDAAFLLEERLRDSERRLDRYKAEAAMSAAGLRKTVEEKEAFAVAYKEVAEKKAALEHECTLYERDLERMMESYDEIAKENDELRSRLQNDAALPALLSELEILRDEKNNLLLNLNKAEDEVKLLADENKILDEENQRLRNLLEKEWQSRSSRKHSAGASGHGKRKSSCKDDGSIGKVIDFSNADGSRQPLSPLLQNSPERRVHKK